MNVLSCGYTKFRDKFAQFLLRNKVPLMSKAEIAILLVISSHVRLEFIV